MPRDKPCHYVHEFPTYQGFVNNSSKRTGPKNEYDWTKLG